MKFLVNLSDVVQVRAPELEWSIRGALARGNKCEEEWALSVAVELESDASLDGIIASASDCCVRILQSHLSASEKAELSDYVERRVLRHVTLQKDVEVQRAAEWCISPNPFLIFDANNQLRCIPETLGGYYALAADERNDRPGAAPHAQRVWPVDAFLTSAADSDYCSVTVLMRRGVNAVLNVNEVGISADGLLEAWVSRGAGQSALGRVIPRQVFDGLREADQCVLRDAFAAIIRAQLPERSWRRPARAPARAREERLSDVELARASVSTLFAELDVCAPDAVAGAVVAEHVLSDLDEIADAATLRIYVEAKRVLSLLEHRIRDVDPECAGNCHNRGANKGRECREVPKRFLGDVLRLKGSHYAVAWDWRISADAWGDCAELSLSEVVQFAAEHVESLWLLQPDYCNAPANASAWSDGAWAPLLRVWSGRAEPRARADDVTEGPWRLPYIGALGQLVVELRNALEHGRPEVREDVVRVAMEGAQSSSKLGLSGRTVTLASDDLLLCVKLVTLLFSACRGASSSSAPLLGYVGPSVK